MMDMDMTWAPGRAPYIELGELPAPLTVAGRSDGTSVNPAYTALERCRSMGNPRLDAAQTPGHWQAARNSRVCEGVSLITFGPLNVGFLVATRDRVMPFAFCSQGSFDETKAALITMVPTFEAIAQVPWFLVDGKPSDGKWANHAIAPPWLPVRQTSMLVEDDVEDVMVGFALSRGLTTGLVHLVGGRFTSYGRFVPPHLYHTYPGSHEIDSRKGLVPGFNPSKLWKGPFPFLNQNRFASGGVASIQTAQLAGLSSHVRMACMHAFLSVVDSPATAHNEVEP